MTKKRPSEYSYTNCYLAASFPDPEDAARFAEIGLDRVMWGSDYPHEKGSYPHTRESLRRTFLGWAASDLRRVVAGNIARIYGFDLNALAPIAARMGSTVDEIATCPAA